MNENISVIAQAAKLTDTTNNQLYEPKRIY